eukprot:UN09212
MLIQIFTTGLEDKEEAVWLQGFSFILTILFNVHVLFNLKLTKTPLQERTYSYVGLLPICWFFRKSFADIFRAQRSRPNQTKSSSDEKGVVVLA